MKFPHHYINLKDPIIVQNYDLGIVLDFKLRFIVSSLYCYYLLTERFSIKLWCETRNYFASEKYILLYYYLYYVHIIFIYVYNLLFIDSFCGGYLIYLSTQLYNYNNIKTYFWNGIIIACYGNNVNVNYYNFFCQRNT